MHEDAFGPIAATLIDGDRAWLSHEQIADTLGWTLLETMKSIVELVGECLLDPWDRPGSIPLFTLSALAAARLGVTLVETPNAEIYRWSRDAASIRNRRAPTAREIERTHDHDAMLRSLVDPRAEDPGEAIDRADRAERRFRSRRPVRASDLPRPTILLMGPALFEWDERPRTMAHRTDCARCRPRPRRKGLAMVEPMKCRCGKGLRRRPKLAACPGCHGRPLSRSTLCLRCGRWGWDDVLARRRRAESEAAKKPKKKAG